MDNRGAVQMSKKSKAKSLWYRWLWTYIAAWVILEVLDLYGLDMRLRTLLTWLVTSFYFYPFLFAIRSCAKEEGAKKILIISKYLIVVMSVWLILASIALVYFLFTGLVSMVSQ